MSMQYITEKEMTGDLLSSIKLTTTGYTHGVLEAADPQLRNTFKDYLAQCFSAHEKIFSFMEQNGMYKVPRIMDESSPEGMGGRGGMGGGPGGMGRRGGMGGPGGMGQ